MSRALIEEISTQYDFPIIASEEAFNEKVKSSKSCVVYLSGDPKKYPEASDVIVVLPELLRAFENQFEIVVADESLEKTLAAQYGINLWPAMVFLKSGEYVDVITRMRDWEDYLRDIPKILDQEPKRAPSIGIPVVVQ